MRVLNPMTVEEADRAGIDALERRRLFRVDDGKQNMTLPDRARRLARLESVDLGNGAFGIAGDNVQVAVAWQMPGAFEKVTEQHLSEVQRQMGEREFATASQAENWLGWLVGRVTGIETFWAGGTKCARTSSRFGSRQGSLSGSNGGMRSTSGCRLRTAAGVGDRG